jgi:hypothetical protein
MQPERDVDQLKDRLRLYVSLIAKGPHFVRRKPTSQELFDQTASNAYCGAMTYAMALMACSDVALQIFTVLGRILPLNPVSSRQQLWMVGPLGTRSELESLIKQL